MLDEHLQAVLPTCHDAIGLMLMIRMTHQHQVGGALGGLGELRWEGLPADPEQGGGGSR